MIQLGDYKITSRSEFRYNCPFCIIRIGKEDKKHHLYVNPDKEMFFCYRCGTKGSTDRLFGHSLKLYSTTKWDAFFANLKHKGATQINPIISMSLPKDYNKMLPNTKAYRYLHSRGITDEQIKLYSIGFGTQNLRKVPDEEKKLYAGSGRIIFPDFDYHGNCVYWVARTYVNHTLRYKNPPDSSASNVLYNLRMASQYEDVVITEGPTSAIAAGRNAVATLGKGITSEQVEMLVAGNWSRYIIALDADAKKEAIKLADKLVSRGCRVSVISFKGNEDPASVSDIEDRIANAIQYKTIKDKLAFTLG